VGVSRIFIELSYDGRAFHGWQRQPGARTVQTELERALAVCARTEHPVPVVGCGRTDAGVHASYFVAHAELDAAALPEPALVRLNGLLPPEIAVSGIHSVGERAHARFSATERTYRYLLHAYKDPFLTGRSTRLYRAPDGARMAEAANLLVRKGDFGAFCRTGGDSATTVCDVRKAVFTAVAPGRWEFEIVADRFLRNMVRAAVGTLLEVGYGRRTVEEFAAVLASGDRTRAGKSAPAEGLYLCDVRYPEAVFCRV